VQHPDRELVAHGAQSAVDEVDERADEEPDADEAVDREERAVDA
jgi:hypothetical protein